MTDPISFASVTPRYELPLLFSGQAAKEFYVNEAHARADLLLHAACEGESANPPATPADGESWLVASGADGDWSGEDGKLASWQSGIWLFVQPLDGMRLFDKATGQVLLFSGEWKRPQAPAAPTGGTTVDAEARDAIADLIGALVEGGILSTD